MHSDPPRRAALLLLALLALAACERDDASLHLRLIADPAVNSEIQLLNVVETIEVVLDAAEGFEGVQSPGPAGDFVAEQTDEDDPLELVLRRGLQGLSRLPSFHVLPGRNAGRPFELAVRGTVGGDLAATSGRQTVTLGWGQEVFVPLGLRARYRPPRVLITSPYDGESAVSALGQVYLEFSKRVATETIGEGVRLVYEGSAGEVELPVEVEPGEKEVTELGLKEVRSTVTLWLGCPLNPGTYRLEVDHGLTDAQGRPLDEDPTTDEAEPYRGRFTVAGGRAMAQPCGADEQGCRDETDCYLEGGQPVQPSGGKFFCDRSAGETYGRCVPADDNFCGGAVACPPDRYVCTAEGACVEDCRLVGYCASSDLRCDEQTGECSRCTDADCTTEVDPNQCEQLCAASCDNAWDSPGCQSCQQSYCG